MATIRIKLFGDCDVRLGADSHPHFRLKKAKVLLAYLALQQGEPVSREKLAHLLWSNRETKQARASLRQALSELRNVLGQIKPAPLITNSINMALDPVPVEVDACQFVRLSGQTDEASLQTAADLYQGPFFDGVDAVSPAFEDWLDQQRRDYHQRAIRILTKLLAFDVTGNRREPAIANAEKLLGLDPLCDATCRTLMELLAADGQSARALQQFDQCQVLLKRELDVAPEPETVALADRIRSDRLSDVSGRIEIQPEKPNVRGNLTEEEIAPPATGPLSGPAEKPWPFARGRKAVVAVGAGLAIVLSLFAYTLPVSRKAPFADTLPAAVTGSTETAALRIEPTSSIVDVLAMQIDTGERTPDAGMLSSDPRADHAYRQGLVLFRKQTPADLSDAITRFERALALDPEFSQAEAALANTYLYGHVMHWPTIAGLAWASDALEQAKALARKAIRRENPPALAYTVLAKTRYFGTTRPGRYDTAVSLARQAFVLDPNDPATYIGLGQIFIYGGEPERALPHLELARKFDPANSGAADYYLALAFFHMERFAQAATNVERALEKSPDAYTVWALAAAVYGYLGRKQEAIFAINHARSLSQAQGVGPISVSLTPGYMAYARSMDRARLRVGLNVACFLIGVNLGE